MTTEEWTLIRYFRPTDNWGDALKMEFKLVSALDEFRHVAGTPIVVTCGTQGSHVENSEHHKGKAVDIVFPNLFVPRLFDMLVLASRFSFFGGIGIYPHWKYNGAVHGGLHLDIRETKPRAYWMGVPEVGGQKYLPLTGENLKTYGLV